MSFCELPFRIEFFVDDVLGFLRQGDGRIAKEPTLVRIGLDDIGLAGHRIADIERMLVGRYRQPRGETVAIGRRAIQVSGSRLELERFARTYDGLAGCQIELHALGQELLDPQRERIDDVLAVRRVAELDLVAAGRRIGGNRVVPRVVAQRLRVELALHELAAVGLLEYQEQRLWFDGFGVVVAHQRGQPHGLARAVQVAARPREHVEPGLLAAADIEPRQVQCRLVERQHRGVAAVGGDHHVLAVECVGEQRIAGVVGAASDDLFACRVDDLHVHTRDRRAGLQRCGMHEHPVLVGARVQADVADEEQRGLVAAAEMPGLLHRREIQAGLVELLDVLDRKIGQRALVLLAAEHEAVGVHRIGEVVDRRALAPARIGIEVVVSALAVALILRIEGREFLVADAEELDVDLRHIDRHHWQAARLACRQHAALRSESNHRFEWAGIDVANDVRTERRSVGGSELAVDPHAVFHRRLDERETQQLVVVLVERPAALDDGAIGVGHADHAVEVLGTDQGPVEFERNRQFVATAVRIRRQQGEDLGHDARIDGFFFCGSSLNRRDSFGVAFTAGEQRQGKHRNQQQPRHNLERGACTDRPIRTSAHDTCLLKLREYRACFRRKT